MTGKREKSTKCIFSWIRTSDIWISNQERDQLSYTRSELYGDNDIMFSQIHYFKKPKSLKCVHANE